MSVIAHPARGGPAAHLQCSLCGHFSKSHAHQLTHMAAAHPTRLDGVTVGRLGNILMYQNGARLFHCSGCFFTSKDFSKLYKHLISRHCEGGGEEEEERREEEEEKKTREEEQETNKMREEEGEQRKSKGEEEEEEKEQRKSKGEEEEEEEEQRKSRGEEGKQRKSKGEEEEEEKKKKREEEEGEQRKSRGEEGEQRKSRGEEGEQRKSRGEEGEQRKSRGEEGEQRKSRGEEGENDALKRSSEEEEEEEEEGRDEEACPQQGDQSVLMFDGAGYVCLICGWKTKLKALGVNHVVRKHDIPKAYASQAIRRDVAGPPEEEEGGAGLSGEQLKEEMEATAKVVRFISNRFVCLLCGWKTKLKGFAISHVVRCHDVERPYGCRSCSRCFFLPSRLQQHVRAAHRPGRYACPFCCFRSHFLGGFRRHCSRCNARGEGEGGGGGEEQEEERKERRGVRKRRRTERVMEEEQDDDD